MRGGEWWVFVGGVVVGHLGGGNRSGGFVRGVVTV